MLTRAKQATGMYPTVQMGTKVNGSKDNCLKEKGLLHGLLLPCGKRGPMLPNHPETRQNPEILTFINVTFSDF